MKKLSLSITLPDNGGVAFFGPLMATSVSSKSPGTYNNQRMYICPTSDPAEVGKTLMAMLADLAMTDPISKVDADIDISF